MFCCGLLVHQPQQRSTTTAMLRRESKISGRFTPTELIEVRLKTANSLGLGGTYSPSGIYNDKGQDYNKQLNVGIQLRLDYLTHGN